MADVIGSDLTSVWLSFCLNVWSKDNLKKKKKWIYHYFIQFYWLCFYVLKVSYAGIVIELFCATHLKLTARHWNILESRCVSISKFLFIPDNGVINHIYGEKVLLLAREYNELFSFFSESLILFKFSQASVEYCIL